MGHTELDRAACFDYLPGALIEINLYSRKVIFMNRIARSLFLYEPKDLEGGISLRSIFWDDEEYERSISLAEKFGLESYQNKTPYERFEQQDLYDFRFVRKTGERFIGECQGSFVLDDNQVPTGTRIYIRDVSEQRQREADHIANEDRYRSLVENTSDLIFLIEKDYTVRSVNAAVERFMGTKRINIEGHSINELFPAETAEKFRSYLTDTLLTGEQGVYETVMPRTQKQRWISTSINPVRDADGNVTGILGVSRDITAKKQAQARMEEALLEARNANQVKAQFLSNITHEIRTPLTSIIGFTDRLKKSLGKNLSPDIEDFFKFISNGSQRLTRAVDAIIKISQLEAGALDITPKPVHLGPLVQLILDKLQPEAIEKGLALELNLLTEQDTVHADEHTIFEALLNLLHNAIKYTEEGGIIVQIERLDDSIDLSITDTGIGISDVYLQRIFNLFTQESEGLNKDYQGMGLGLALTKRYLDLNKVGIRVQSEKGLGSTFSLSFPLRSEET